MKISLTITVDAEVANDLRLFYAKAMQGNHKAACMHPRAMRVIGLLPASIDQAAAQQREIERIAAGGAQ